MKMKLFLCVLCLAFFADGLLPQTAPVDEATRLAQVEMMQEIQGEAIREVTTELHQINQGLDRQFMWSVGIVVALFVAGYALIHQMRTQLSDFMVKMLDMHQQLVNKMAELQGEMVQLRAEMNAKFVEAESDTSQLRNEMNSKFVNVQADMSELQIDVTTKMADLRGDVSDAKSDLQSDVSDVKSDLRSDIGDVKINVGGLQKDVAIIQKDVGELNEKVDGIDAHVTEVERSTNAQLTDIRETLAKQQETETETPKKEADSS